MSQPTNENDHFSEAAVRHFVDGDILQKAGRMDNAMCHYAFSAECAIKAFYERICTNRGYQLKHNVKEVWKDIQQYYTVLRVLDAKAGTLFACCNIPEGLFDGHPGRRYKRDKVYSAEILKDASDFSELLVQNNIQCGAVDYLLEASVSLEGENVDMSNMILQVTDPVVTENLNGEIFVIPAGKVDDNYLQKLARIDYQDAVPNNMKTQLTRLIEDAVERIAAICHVDYILLDSRAGFHDMGGVITTQIPHGVVLFGKDSRQSWHGLERVVQAISTSQEEKPFILLVDSACGRDGLVGTEEKQAFKNQAYTVCCDAYYWEDEQWPGLEAVDEAHSPVFVPYQPLLAGNIQLFSDGTERQNEMVRQVKQMLMGENYQPIKKRVRQWFYVEEARQDGQAENS